MNTNRGISQDWTKFNTDNTPLDIQHYVKIRPCSVKGNDFYQHMEGLQETVRAYWEESPDLAVLANTREHWKESQCSNLLKSVPWLNSFTTEDGNLTPAISALSTSENLCNRLLLRLSVLLSNAIIMSDWKLRALKSLKGFEHWSGLSTLHYSANTVTNIIRGQIERKDILIFSLWQQLQESVSNYPTHRNFKTLASKVANFCLEAGCPAVKYEPTDDIYCLRQYLLSHNSGVREAELRKEITRLNNINRAQQRIITNLAFRHLLEMLPTSSAKPLSATAKWHTFFQTASKAAQIQQARGQMDHPLIPVLRKYDRPKQITDVGISLYSTLSTNIHHFSAQFVVLDDQWNMLEADILKALTPLNQNKMQTGIDWERERLRY